MSNSLILRSKKPSFEIPLKSVGEVIWKKLQELNSETTCIVSNEKNFILNNISLYCYFYSTIRSMRKVAQK